MSHSPAACIAEILGVKIDPVRPLDTSGSFYCPHIQRKCTKRSTQDKSKPYPVCSIYKRGTSDAICICPKRFYESNFLDDVFEHCWQGSKPQNPVFVKEIKMKGFGNVDYVIADIIDGEVSNFLSVELQAIDITGSVRPAYDAFIAGEQLERLPTYNFNWDNVYKRYITQLIRKGYFHHHWKSKIVAVIQDAVYRDICSRADFMRSSDVHDPNVNIIFMSYQFQENDAGKLTWRLDKVEGTSHSALQNAVLYTQPPDRGEFCDRILKAVDREK